MINYGYQQQANQFNTKCQRDAALNELKTEIEKAIPDEQGAVKMYDRMTILAMNAGLNDKATIIELIKEQESNHERIFRDMMRQLTFSHA